MLYFAYGSNMCTGRLRRRVPSAVPLWTAKLLNHSFRFHKRSRKDTSGRGDAFFTGEPNDIVRGVLFEIDADEECKLDTAEGLGFGYCKQAVTVQDGEGKQHRAFMYVAEETYIAPELKPYSWYKRFVAEGARQHGLPAAYIAQIETIEADEDPGAPEGCGEPQESSVRAVFLTEDA
jgi:gamma-glutamylcyclotransferase